MMSTSCARNRYNLLVTVIPVLFMCLPAGSTKGTSNSATNVTSMKKPNFKETPKSKWPVIFPSPSTIDKHKGQARRDHADDYSSELSSQEERTRTGLFSGAKGSLKSTVQSKRIQKQNKQSRKPITTPTDIVKKARRGFTPNIAKVLSGISPLRSSNEDLQVELNHTKPEEGLDRASSGRLTDKLARYIHRNSKQLTRGSSKDEVSNVTSSPVTASSNGAPVAVSSAPIASFMLTPSGIAYQALGVSSHPPSTQLHTGQTSASSGHGSSAAATGSAAASAGADSAAAVGGGASAASGPGGSAAVAPGASAAATEGASAASTLGSSVAATPGATAASSGGSSAVAASGGGRTSTKSSGAASSGGTAAASSGSAAASSSGITGTAMSSGDAAAALNGTASAASRGAAAAAAGGSASTTSSGSAAAVNHGSSSAAGSGSAAATSGSAAASATPEAAVASAPGVSLSTSPGTLASASIGFGQETGALTAVAHTGTSSVAASIPSTKGTLFAPAASTLSALFSGGQHTTKMADSKPQNLNNLAALTNDNELPIQTVVNGNQGEGYPISSVNTNVRSFDS